MSSFSALLGHPFPLPLPPALALPLRCAGTAIFAVKTKIVGKTTCKRQGEVCLWQIKQHRWLSSPELRTGEAGDTPGGVGVVSSWVIGDWDLFLALPWAGWGTWGSLYISSPNQREQLSPLQSAFRCDLAMDEELIMHPRQPSLSCPPTPPPTFGSRHSGQHFSHPKVCFALLPWHRVL